MDRIRRAVEHASNEAHGSLIILLEWTANTEASIHSFRVLCAFQERLAALEAVAKKETRPLPPPWETSRKVPLGYGRLAREEPLEAAKDWTEFRYRCLGDIEEALTFRWRDVLGYEAVFDEMAQAMGEPLIHRAVRELLDGLRDSVLRLTLDTQCLDEEFQLPEEPGEHGGMLRESIDWQVIHGAPKEKHAREWMHPSRQEELEAWERGQAEDDEDVLRLPHDRVRQPIGTSARILG
jgi:hypothetical protein